MMNALAASYRGGNGMIQPAIDNYRNLWPQHIRAFLAAHPNIPGPAHSSISLQGPEDQEVQICT